MEHLEPQSNFIFYADEKGNTNINVIVDNDTVWVTQASMSEVFGVVKSTISEHFSNIYESGELNKEATVRKIRTVQWEGT